MFLALRIGAGFGWWLRKSNSGKDDRHAYTIDFAMRSKRMVVGTWIGLDLDQQPEG